jgi:hypothetical protein
MLTYFNHRIESIESHLVIAFCLLFFSLDISPLNTIMSYLYMSLLLLVVALALPSLPDSRGEKLLEMTEVYPLQREQGPTL